MTVWILKKGINYEGFSIDGVFSSRELAQERLNEIVITEHYYDWFDIIEWEVI